MSLIHYIEEVNVNLNRFLSDKPIPTQPENDSIPVPEQPKSKIIANKTKLSKSDF
jgi:hypothetical protein